jgi:hypothetical protein
MNHCGTEHRRRQRQHPDLLVGEPLSDRARALLAVVLGRRARVEACE